MTVIAVLAVVAGPATIECSSSGDLISCLRDRISGSGLIENEPEPAIDAPAEAVVEPGSAPVPGEDAIGEPRFDLLRVERDGSAVIAGRGEPGTSVNVYLGDKLLGSSAVAQNGDWVVVPGEPLPTGASGITVREADSDKVATQAFAVVIDPGKEAEPRVVASTPEGLPKLVEEMATEAAAAIDSQDAPAADPAPTPTGDSSTQVAPASDRAALEVAEAIDGQLTLEPIPVPPVATTGNRARTEVAEALAEEIGLAAPTAAPGRRAAVEVGEALADEQLIQPTPQIEVANLPAPRAGAEVLEALADERKIAVASAPTKSAVDRAGAEVAAALGAERAVEIAVHSHPAGARAREEVAAALGATILQTVPELSSGEGTAGAVRDRAMADVAMALADERDILPNGSVASPGEQLVADVPLPAPVTLEAIEIDGEDNYFAGGGVEGATVRVFVDGALAGETTVADGRWLVEAAGTLTKDEQRVRAEMLEDDGLLSVAEANFVLEGPTRETLLPAPGNAVDDRGAREVALAVEDIITPGANGATDRAAAEVAEALGAARTVEPSELTPSESAADRARMDVAEAVSDIRAIEPLEAVAIPEAISPRANDPRDRAVADTRAALADVRDVEIAAVPVAAATPPGDRAAADVSVALGAMRTVAVLEPAPDSSLAPAPDGAAERANVDVAVALADELSIEMPQAAAPQDALGLQAEPPAGRASREVIAALGDERDVAPVEPRAAPPVQVPLEIAVDDPAKRARDEVDVALAGELTVAPREVSPPLAPQVPDAPVDVAAVEEMPPPVVVEIPKAPLPATRRNPAPEVESTVDVAVATPEAPAAAASSEVPTITGVVMGESQMRRFTPGSVIIRRGDNLWDIAKRIYGLGTKYRTIYNANRDQIRRPSRIYPGQVLVVPLVYND